MTQKTKKLWQLVMLLALDLALLVFISTLSSSTARAMRMGYSGERVAEVQRILNIEGFFVDNPSGTYCIKTNRAIKEFQKTAGMECSGEADFETLKKMGISSCTSLCFTAETELLARCIQQSGCQTYSEMLNTGQEIIQKTKAARTMGSYVCEFFPNAVNAGEPSAAAYSAALHAIREQ